MMIRRRMATSLVREGKCIFEDLVICVADGNSCGVKIEEFGGRKGFDGKK